MDKLLYKAFMAAHVGVYRLTGGRLAGSMRGGKVLVLTTMGRRSGKPWTVPLMDIRHDGYSHVIASAGGDTKEPGWYKNVLATPTVGVQRGEETFRATAVVLEGDERDTVYEVAESQMSDFTGYKEKTGRVIPVVRLVPVEG